MKTMRQFSILLRSVEVWLVISVAETLHGIARIALLQPLVGDFTARQIAVFSGSAIIVVVALVFRNWINAARFREQLSVGAVWVVLTITFEIVLGRFVMDLSWERILSDYNIANGGLMPLGLLVMLFAPVISRYVA